MSSPLWYSSLSTGILEIDQQHANIDALMQLCENESSSARELEWLNLIHTSLKAHFEFEEVYFGDNFPSEHKIEHQRLLGIVAERLELRRIGRLTTHRLVDELHKALIDHVNRYDLELGELSRA